MTRFRHHIGVAMAVAILTGCASAPHGRPPNGAMPKPIDVHMPLEGIGMAGTLTQQVVGEFDGKSQTLRFEVELTREHLAVVAMTALGIPVFAIAYDGTASSVTTYVKGVPIPPPAWILDDILISNAPEVPLRNTLTASGYRLKTGPEDRRVFDGKGRLIMHIHYTKPADTAWGRDLVLEDEMLHYRLTVTTLAKSLQGATP